MPSIIEGYEYDIFISYRQKDNKHDGWVTEFVKNLKGELESTFKEDISVYFDENPHDGLLETHVVEDSLKYKLNCLVFIPILSRTYCDKRSFAWVNEFEAFVNAASKDSFGLKVKLPNGNVASRVLPVRIYDLDPSDSSLFESVIGSMIRSVDFIYSSSGINRPLLPKEDRPNENLNHTTYRDQINKVGNALKDIIYAMSVSGSKSDSVRKPASSFMTGSFKFKKNRKILIISLFILLLLLVSGIFILPGVLRHYKIEKSVAVLPFIDDSMSDSSTYFMNMLMEGVISNLQSINDLSPRSRTSAEKFRKSRNTLPETAKELGVNYIVEGVGQKSGKKFHINVTLYRVIKKEVQLWSQVYDQDILNAKDIFGLGSQIAEAIAEELKAVVTPQEKQRIEKAPTANLAAYEDYLLGKSYLNRYFHQNFDVAMQHFEHAKNKDSTYALAWVGISEVWLMRAVSSYSSPVEAKAKAIAALNKAYQLDSTLAEVHATRCRIRNYLLYDVSGAELSIKKALSISPNNVLIKTIYANQLVIMGKPDEAAEQIESALKLDPLNLDTKGPYGVIMFCARRYENAIGMFNELLKIDPENGTALDNLPLALHMAGRYTEAIQVWESLFSIYFRGNANMFKKNPKLKNYKDQLNLQGDSLAGNLKTHYIDPTEIAQIYACAENKAGTLEMLESAFNVRDPNLPYVLRYPIFDFLKDETRFQDLIHKLNLP